MTTALFSFGVFTAAWLAHLALWRTRVPRPATGILLVIFLGALPVAFVAAWLGGLRLAPWMIVQATLFHVAASLAYIIIYAGIEEPSPTLTLVRTVEGAGARGCSIDELSAALTDAALVDVRLDTLQASGLAQHAFGMWNLTPRGVQLARVMRAFSVYVLNRPKGG